MVGAARRATETKQIFVDFEQIQIFQGWGRHQGNGEQKAHSNFPHPKKVLTLSSLELNTSPPSSVAEHGNMNKALQKALHKALHTVYTRLCTRLPRQFFLHDIVSFFSFVRLEHEVAHFIVHNRLIITHRQEKSKAWPLEGNTEQLQ